MKKSLKELYPRPTRDQNNQFREIFGWDLYRYWDWSGFDVVAFDHDLKVPDGVSCSDHVRALYGDAAVKLIEQLLRRPAWPA